MGSQPFHLWNGSSGLLPPLYTPEQGCTARAHRWCCGCHYIYSALNSPSLSTMHPLPTSSHNASTVNRLSSCSKYRKPFSPSVHTYRPVFSIFICASTITEGDTFVSTEDKARITKTSFHTRLVARATGVCRILTAGLGTGRATWGVLTAWGALQGWEAGKQDSFHDFVVVLVCHIVQADITEG